jgi:hypothetical protein
MKDVIDSVLKNNRVNHVIWAKKLLSREKRGEAVSPDALKQARAVVAVLRALPEAA